MNRRHFLRAIGAAVAVTAGGIELLELAVPKRTFFLPPAVGWSGYASGGFETFTYKYLYGIAVFPIAIIRGHGELILSGKLTCARPVSSDAAVLA
jgi:hypothetical protein